MVRSALNNQPTPTPDEASGVSKGLLLLPLMGLRVLALLSQTGNGANSRPPSHFLSRTHAHIASLATTDNVSGMNAPPAKALRSAEAGKLNLAVSGRKVHQPVRTQKAV